MGWNELWHQERQNRGGRFQFSEHLWVPGSEDWQPRHRIEGCRRGHLIEAQKQKLSSSHVAGLSSAALESRLLAADRVPRLNRDISLIHRATPLPSAPPTQAASSTPSYHRAQLASGGPRWPGRRRRARDLTSPDPRRRPKHFRKKTQVWIATIYRDPNIRKYPPNLDRDH